MGVLKKIGIGIAVLFAIIIIIGMIGAMFTPTGRVTEPLTEETKPTETTTPTQQPKEIIVKGLGDTIENGGLAVTLRSVTPDYEYYENEYYFVVTMDVNVVGDKIYISPGRVIDARKYQLNRANMGELTWNLGLLIFDSKNNAYKTVETVGYKGEVVGSTLRLTGLFSDKLSYSIDNITIILFGKDERYKAEDLTKFIFRVNLAQVNNIDKCKEGGDYNFYCVYRMAFAYGNLSYCNLTKYSDFCIESLRLTNLAIESKDPSLCKKIDSAIVMKECMLLVS